MIAENAESTKSQTPRIRGNEETIQSGINSKWGGRTGQTGQKNGDKSFPVNRDDRTGRTITSPGGQGTPGGIVDRLISKMKTLIEESENRTADLKEQLEELEQLSQQLQEQEYSE